ncbi:MAG: hypothetical protein IJV82_00980 [Oscillospiraceae bacterium]|nr:hypothetical protein [Oscillospiraceae bacterium]
MLYVTTRSKHDVYTPAITMQQNRGPDGGLFVPFKMPEFDRSAINALADKTFGQNVADILNLFFGTKLTGWDVDMAIGRNPFKIRSMNFRILIGELYHNMEANFDRMIRVLSERVHPDGDIIGKHSDWLDIAVRIGVLFGIFGELIATEQIRSDKPINIAVSSGNFASPMAAWYARQMGLPIGTIICGCNQNGAPWDLLHRGELDTDAIAVNTSTPKCDYALPPDLERLICAACNQDETLNYCFHCTEGGTYRPDRDAHAAIRQGMFAAVVSGVRVQTIIPSVYHTNRYILDQYSALAYGALADYRSRTGKSTMTLLLVENSPVTQGESIAKAMNITVPELKKRLAEG